MNAPLCVQHTSEYRTLTLRVNPKLIECSILLFGPGRKDDDLFIAQLRTFLRLQTTLVRLRQVNKTKPAPYRDNTGRKKTG